MKKGVYCGEPLSFFCHSLAALTRLQAVYLAGMSALQFAIVGCGRIAARHADEAVKQGQLAAVCDIVPARADALATSYGCRAYYQLSDMLSSEKKIDVLAVCSPNGLHAEHSILALRAGCDVLCEKPLSITVSDAEKMIQAATSSGRKLFVVKSARYNPVLAGLKNVMQENKLGRIYSFQMNCFWNRPASYYENSWRGTELDGGTLFTQFSHYIDALLWLLGDLKEVKGYRRNLAHKGIVRTEDSGVIAVEMETGVTGGINWSVNTFRENMEVSLCLLAERGTVRLGGGYMNEISYALSEENIVPLSGGGGPNDYGFYKGSMSHHDQVYRNLVKALAHDDHPFTSAEDGLRTVRAIEKIYTSVPLT